MPHYPTRCAGCHGVPARRGGRDGRQPSGSPWSPSSRSTARAAPRAAASRWPPRPASAPARWPAWPRPAALRPWSPPPRRVLVYVGALALSALVSYASIAWSLTPQTSYGDANRWLVAAAAAAGATCSPACCAVRSRPPCGCSAPPRCRSSPTPSSSARTACSSRPRRGCRACSAIPTRSAPTRRSRRPPRCGSRAPRSAPGASPGCGTLALLVLGLALASSRGGVLAAVIGCGVWLAVSRPAHRERRGAARRARRDRAGGALGARPALLQGARRALHRARGLAPGLVLARGRAGVRGARPAGGGARSARGPARPPRLRPRGRWPSLVVGALLAAVRLSSQHGGPIGALSHVWHQLSGGGAVGSTDHLTQLSTNLRGRWWGEAWDGFTAHPLARQRRRHVRDDRPPGATRLPAGRPGALGVPARALGPRAAGRASRR